MGPPEFTIQSGTTIFVKFLHPLLLTVCLWLTDPLLKSGPLRKQRRHIGGWVTRWFVIDWEETTGMACLNVHHKDDLSDPPTRISLEQ